MSKIACKLFGVPKITKDGRNIFLPYAKINALLYYILVAKVVSRDEIAGLLWPDESEEVAKKNLRNAIYQAKKSLGEDIIISPKKSFLILNENLEIETDIDLFSRSPREHLHLYSGDFLQGFFLKEAESYEYWIMKMRNLYREKFAAECYLKIEEDIQNKHYDKIEHHIQRLTELDEYDERNIRLLMRFYQDTGRNGKVIETYYELAKLLRRELGINPDRKTKEIYERSLEQINFGEDKNSYDDSFFYGRYDEIAALEKAMKSFQQKKDGKSLLITGEAGVGKSTVKRKLLEEVSGNFFVLEARCHQAEQDLPLRPWRMIAREISHQIQESKLIPPALWKSMMTNLFPDFSENLPNALFSAFKAEAPIETVVHVMVEALIRLASQRQVLLVLEDLQWMDTDSLRLLTSTMLETDPVKVMLVATCSKERNRATEDMLTALRHHHRLVTVPLERFNIEACHHFIEKALPHEELKGETLERIYNETEGNPFFLSEYIELMKSGSGFDTMTQAMLEALKTRFLYLSADEWELVHILSFSYDEFPLEMLLQITEKSQTELLLLLESLKDRAILMERETEQDIAISFTHTKLREYIYMSQPSSRKKIMHQKIGLLLEHLLEHKKRDYKLCSKLIYHFSASGDYLKALKYKIETLNYHLNFSHEMFPILNNLEMEQDAKLYMSRDKLDELFHNLETSLHEIQSSAAPSPELDLLEVEFFYMKGRYLIREGRYENGVNNIINVIEKSKQIGNRDYTLEGYKQMILYHIQTNNPKDMLEFLESALDLAVRCNYHKEIGILLRLKGLYNMMTGNYLLAEKLLTESINTLAVTEEVAKRYAINIAAAYNYIGEIRQAEENYPGALQLFDKAISLCSGKNALSSLSIFYINAGKTAYFIEDIATARDYFEKAYSLYGQFDSFWRRPILDSYMALTLIKEQQYEQALHYLMTARENAGHMKNPSDLGTVCFVEALIRKMADQDRTLWNIFGESLPEHPNHYYQLALKNLNKYRDNYEINILNKTFDCPQANSK